MRRGGRKDRRAPSTSVLASSFAPSTAHERDNPTRAPEPDRGEGPWSLSNATLVDPAKGAVGDCPLSFNQPAVRRLPCVTKGSAADASVVEVTCGKLLITKTKVRNPDSNVKGLFKNNLHLVYKHSGIEQELAA